MKSPTSPKRLPFATLALCLLAPGIAAAGSDPETEFTDGQWHYGASIYAFVPRITGDLHAATPAGNDFAIAADDLIKNTKFAAMGRFEAQKGRWGLFADVLYMNVGDSISNSPTIGQGSLPLPPGVTADASLDVEATAFTIAANYRAIATATDTFDVFGGARLLDAKTELKWQFNTPMGPLPPPLGQGRGEASKDGWDGIVGIKGRHRFGARRQWFVPYYVDAGTGASDFTWQAATGIGYSAGWGDMFLIWRHLDYDFGRDRMIDNLQFSGPALGVAFTW
ncbi:hypothetical protein GCM10027431_21090 [Lysobacter rhizosphaerae]